MPIKTKQPLERMLFRLAQIEDGKEKDCVITNELRVFVKHLNTSQRVELLLTLATVIRNEAEQQELDSHTEGSRDMFVISHLITGVVDYYSKTSWL